LFFGTRTVQMILVEIPSWFSYCFLNYDSPTKVQDILPI